MAKAPMAIAASTPAVTSTVRRRKSEERIVGVVSEFIGLSELVE
jgi:hypothetical protein